jgi:hypothetical protein
MVYSISGRASKLQTSRSTSPPVTTQHPCARLWVQQPSYVPPDWYPGQQKQAPSPPKRILRPTKRAL